MQNNNEGQPSRVNRRFNRLKSHKELSLNLHLDEITNFKKRTEENLIFFDNIEHKNTNYNIGGTKTFNEEITTNYRTNAIKKKSSIKKNRLANEEDRHVTFEIKPGKDNNAKIIKQKPALKKTKSNYIFKGPTLNDFSNRCITETQKPMRLSTGLTNKSQNDYDDDEWDIDKYKDLKKKTLDVNDRKRNFKLNSEFSSINYIKLAQATSQAGKDNGVKKINQDSYVSEKNINGILNFNVFGVLDGHGPNGHFASQFTKKYIINRIKSIPLVKNLAKPKEIYNHLVANNYKIISDIFADADVEITKEKFNCENSGTTCVIVFELEENLICANAGDSRAILIYDEKNDENLKSTKIFPLSFDCKPQNPSERKRITEKGGVVRQDVDENGKAEGPYRVWVKGESYPGIAISRSIGDTDAKTIGVIPNPQVIEYKLSPKSKYMIICSDGIWEYIKNEQAMNIGNPYYIKKDALGLCNELTKKSTEIWDKEGFGDVDDITVVVAFF